MEISVICPFFNEEEIIEQAVRTMLNRLKNLDESWELIVVNDGSTDHSETIVRQIAGEHPHLRVVGYSVNRGRGYALRTGIASASGAIIVTTEIDLSWGENIVEELVQALKSSDGTDIIVASPNLPGGSYRNVPKKRVWLSRIGNRVIRTCMADAVTMNTGMTRAYRREVIQSLPLTEDGKEFHLEVILKATSFGYRIKEIPAVLEWKDYKHRGKRVKRKSSSQVNRLVLSHSLFSVFANPVRYVWLMSIGSFLLSVVFMVFALILAFMNMVSAFSALMGITLLVVAIVLFVLGVVVKQGNMIQRELWMLQRNQLLLQQNQVIPLNPTPEEHSFKSQGSTDSTDSLG